MTNSELNTIAGGRVHIELVMPTAYGRLPKWRATVGSKSAEFSANDNGNWSSEDGLNVHAAKALAETQPERAKQ